MFLPVSIFILRQVLQVIESQFETPGVAGQVVHQVLKSQQREGHVPVQEEVLEIESPPLEGGEGE